jgi:4-coumarate--CoA ligase
MYDDENNRVVKRGEPGHFHINSPTTINNYLENVDEDAFVEDENGSRWFKTGDVGFIDEDGVVYLLGRLNDRIKRAGIRITPAALETSLSAYIGSQVCRNIRLIPGIVWPTTYLVDN